MVTLLGGDGLVSTLQLVIVCVTAIAALHVVARPRGARRSVPDVDGREVVVFLKDGQSLRGVAETNGSATLHLHDAVLMSGQTNTRLQGTVHIAEPDTLAVQVLRPERVERAERPA